MKYVNFNTNLLSLKKLGIALFSLGLALVVHKNKSELSARKLKKYKSVPVKLVGNYKAISGFWDKAELAFLKNSTAKTAETQENVNHIKVENAIILEL